MKRSGDRFKTAASGDTGSQLVAGCGWGSERFRQRRQRGNDFFGFRQNNGHVNGLCRSEKLVKSLPGFIAGRADIGAGNELADNVVYVFGSPGAPVDRFEKVEKKPGRNEKK